MAEYIDKSALYEKIAQLEEIARNRYLETPSSNPCCSRYMTQLNERTVFKHIIADFPAADVAPVRHGKWEGHSHSRYCGTDDFGDPIYKEGVVYYCSECRRKTVIKERYCPNCGAKMDLEDA